MFMSLFTFNKAGELGGGLLFISMSIIQLFGYCWSTTSRFGEIKQLHDLRNYGAINARVFYVFCSFQKFEMNHFQKTTCQNMP